MNVFRRLVRAALAGVVACTASAAPIALAQEPAFESASESAAPVAAPAIVRVGDALAAIETRLAGYTMSERFALVADGRRVDYIAVRSGGSVSDPGLYFEDGVLTRIVGAADRRVYAACRTLDTGRGSHWMGAGADRYLPILQAAQDSPASIDVKPLSTRLGQVVNDGTSRGVDAFESIASIVPTSLNPAAIPRAVRGLVRGAKDQAQSAQRIETLKRMPVGMSETALVESLGVDWARVERGNPLLWYRKEGFEVLVRAGRVAGVEFPAHHARIDGAAGGYYEPGIDWSRCPQ